MSGNVLIVDDDLGCGRLMAVLIRHMGCKADYVDSGGKALEYLANRKPDLVILDVMMPEIDGMEVLSRMRANPSTAEVPVIMFSAMADPKFCEGARQRGANDYWVKATLDFKAIETRLKPYLASDGPAN